MKKLVLLMSLILATSNASARTFLQRYFLGVETARSNVTFQIERTSQMYTEATDVVYRKNVFNSFRYVQLSDGHFAKLICTPTNQNHGSVQLYAVIDYTAKTATDVRAYTNYATQPPSNENYIASKGKTYSSKSVCESVIKSMARGTKFKVSRERVAANFGLAKVGDLNSSGDRLLIDDNVLSDSDRPALTPVDPPLAR